MKGGGVELEDYQVKKKNTGCAGRRCRKSFGEGGRTALPIE